MSEFMEIPEGMNMDGFGGALANLAMAALGDDADKGKPAAAQGTKKPADESEAPPLQLPGQAPRGETTHVMTFKYHGSDKPKRKPRQIESTAAHLLSFPDLPNTKSSGGNKKKPVANTPAALGQAKEAATQAGIDSGEIWTMVHQFPAIIEAHPRGPTNLNRETWEMTYAGTFEPMTPRGHERIAEYKQELIDKAKREIHERRLDVRLKAFCGNLRERFRGTPKLKKGAPYGRDMGLPDEKFFKRKPTLGSAEATAAAAAAEATAEDGEEASQHGEEEGGEEEEQHISETDQQQEHQQLTARQRSKGPARADGYEDSEEELSDKEAAEEEQQYEVPGAPGQALRVRKGAVPDTDNSPIVTRSMTLNIPARSQNAFLSKVSVVSEVDAEAGEERRTPIAA